VLLSTLRSDTLGALLGQNEGVGGFLGGSGGGGEWLGNQTAAPLIVGALLPALL
jgi:hypothetical protein